MSNKDGLDKQNIHASASADACQPAPEKPKSQDAAKPKRKPSAARKELGALNLLADRGVDGELALDYMAVRKDKRAATLTKTALAGLEREANKANLSLEQALRICCERGWVGFQADWLLRGNGNQPSPGLRQNSINRVPQHTNGGAHLAKDIL